MLVDADVRQPADGMPGGLDDHHEQDGAGPRTTRAAGRTRRPPAGGYVRAWLERHDRIIGHALFQFAVVFMGTSVLYRLAILVFG